MPPAAVIVLAVVSTVGAALAFKHFVYDPHLSHVVRRWREESRQRRRHLVDVQHDRDADDSDVPMLERERSSISRPDDHSALTSSLETTGTRSAGGLLSRRRLGNLLHEEDFNLSSIELENLIARELQDVYHNGSPLENANQLPYVPLSPRRTHVVFNSGSVSPATPAVDNIPNGLPSPPLSTTSTRIPGQTLPSPTDNATSPMGPPSLSGSMRAQDSLFRGPSMSMRSNELQVSQDSLIGSPPPIVDDSSLPFQPNLVSLSPSHHILATASGLSPDRSQEQDQNSPSPFLLPSVPSLSQSYPQELEIEHGLELLSPPSSRSDSPFTMANISPRAPTLSHQNLDGVLHPTSPLSSASTSEVFSPIVPSDIGFANESLHPLSPAVGPTQLALRAAGGSASGLYPALSSVSGPLDSAVGVQLGDMPTPLSRTSSLQSSAYLSCSEPENEEAEDDIPLAARRASLILAMSDHTNSQSGEGLGLTFLPPSPGNPPPPLSPSILSPRSRLAEVSTIGRSIGPLSDTSELSDLDLMSDISASELGEVVSPPESVSIESGRGNIRDRESDASWSVTGDSDLGDGDVPQPPTPHLRPIGELRRDDTVRGRRRL